MSTAYYPQGMRTMPASGRMNGSLPSQYKPWKGTGVFSNPVGVAPSHIRPLTNKDSGNVFKSGSYPSRYPQFTRTFLPRPIKHFRRGRVIPPPEIENPNPESTTDTMQTDLINYNMNRYVKSSLGTSLGNGRNGDGILSALQETPGGYTVKQNSANEVNGEDELNKDCKTCEGVGVTVNYMPNNTYLTENPEANTQNPILCCNEQYKAKRRSIYASTNLKKNYYTTTKQYLQNRCKTYQQKSFNFQDNKASVDSALFNAGYSAKQIAQIKPGTPLSQLNIYDANCYPNAEMYESSEIALVSKLLSILLNKGFISQEEISSFEDLNSYNFDTLFNFLNSLPENQKENSLAEFNLFINNPYWGVPFSGPSNPNGCKLTVYKPNNPQFAKQGAVSSSTRMLKLNVDTISTNAASINHNNNMGEQLITANEIYKGNAVEVTNSNLTKNKSQNKCTAPPPALISGVYTFHNKKACHYQKQLPQYQTPKSQPSPYRYFQGTVFPSGHFTQMPRTYNNPSRSGIN